MPKLKPHKGLRKRVKITAHGKVVRKMSFGGHLMSAKPGTRRQRLRRRVAIESKFADRIKQALGVR
jgi:large subunit ribosomal protein L35